MLLGIGSYTFGWAFSAAAAGCPGAMDIPGLLQRATELGVGVVQVADNAHPESLSAAQLDDLCQRAAEAGIELELGGRGLDPANLRRHILLSKSLNSRLLRFVIDGPGYAPDRPVIAVLLRTAVPELEDAGITLAIENHDRFRAAEFAGLIREVASPAVGICLDTANSFGALEGPAVVIGALAPLTVNLHLKDFRVCRVPYQMGFVVEGTPAGEGMLDVPATVAAVAAGERCRTAILELWTPPGACIEETLRREADWAGRSLAALRAMDPFRQPT